MISKTKARRGPAAADGGGATPAPWQAPGWVERRPYAFAATMVAAVALVIAASAGVLSWLMPESQETTRRLLATSVLAVATLVLLSRWHAWQAMDLRRPRQGAAAWRLLALPVLLAGWGLAFGVEGGLVALAVAIVAEIPNSFAEEALTRGVLVRALAAKRAWVTAVVSGVTFGLLHLVVVVWGAAASEVVPLVIIASLFGVMYACLRMVTASLWVPVGLHCLFNVSQGAGAGSATVGDGLASLILVLSALVLPAYGLLLLRRDHA